MPNEEEGAMTLCGVVHSRSRTLGKWVGAVRLGFVVVALAGCTSGGASQSPVGGQSNSPVATITTSTASQAPTGDIPPGREIAEGGGGPLSYTFREEWRRARAEAQKWRDGAYLISAAGQMVNGDGVPNGWSLRFIDRADADAVLLVDIDPWGKVTQARPITGGGVASFVGQYTERMPYEIIDSDEAVQLGQAALALKYDLAKTKEPSLGLGFSELDGSGPFWTYTLFYQSTADYVSVHVHALTSAVTPVN
jgi:hypothetical protein